MSDESVSRPAQPGAALSRRFSRDTVIFESPAPPAVVLASIRQLAGEWRESKIPPALRADRVLSIEGYVEGERFRFGYMRRWYWRGESELHVSGEVRPDLHGGSVVSVRLGTDGWIGALLALPIIAIAMWLFRGQPGMWVVMIVGAGMIVAGLLSDTRLSRASNSQADYLVTRIEAAVAAATTRHRQA